MRGRTLNSFGQAFTPIGVDSASEPVSGHPTLSRYWGIPTMSWSLPGKWNVFLPPIMVGILSKILELLHRN